MGKAADDMLLGYSDELAKDLPPEWQRRRNELLNPAPVLPPEPYSRTEEEKIADFRKAGVTTYQGGSQLTEEVDRPTDQDDADVRYKTDRITQPIDTFTPEDVLRDTGFVAQPPLEDGPERSELEGLRLRLLSAPEHRFEAWRKSLTSREGGLSFEERRFYEDYFDNIRAERASYLDTLEPATKAHRAEILKQFINPKTNLPYDLDASAPDAPLLTTRLAAAGAGIGAGIGALGGPFGIGAGAVGGAAIGGMAGGALDLLKLAGLDEINDAYWGAVEQGLDSDHYRHAPGGVLDSIGDSVWNVMSFLGTGGDLAREAVGEEIANIAEGDEDTMQWWGDMLLRQTWRLKLGEYVKSMLEFEQGQDVLEAPAEPEAYDNTRTQDGLLDYVTATIMAKEMNIPRPADDAPWSEKLEFQDRVLGEFGTILKNNMTTEERNEASNIASNAKLFAELIGVAKALRVSYGSNRPDFSGEVPGTDWQIEFGNTEQETYEEAYDDFGNRVQLKFDTPKHIVRSGEFYLTPIDALFDFGFPAIGWYRRGSEALMNEAAKTYVKRLREQSRMALDAKTGKRVPVSEVDLDDVYEPVGNLDLDIGAATGERSVILEALEGTDGLDLGDALDMPDPGLIGAQQRYYPEGTRVTGDSNMARFTPNKPRQRANYAARLGTSLDSIQRRLDYQENVIAKLDHAIEQYRIKQLAAGKGGPELEAQLRKIREATRITNKKALVGTLRKEANALRGKIKQNNRFVPLPQYAKQAAINTTISTGASILWTDLEAEQIAAQEAGEILDVSMLRYVALGLAPILGGFVGSRAGLSMAQQRQYLASNKSRLRDLVLGPSEKFKEGLSPEVRSAGDRILDGGERIEALVDEELRRRFAHDPEFMDLILPYSGARGDVAPPRTPDLPGYKSVRFAVRRVTGPKITVDETPTSTTTTQTGGTTLDPRGARGRQVSRPEKGARIQYLSGEATNLRAWYREVGFHGIKADEIDDFGALVLNADGVPIRYVSFTDKTFDASLLPEQLAEAAAKKIPIGWNPNQSLGRPGTAPFKVERLNPPETPQQTSARVAEAAARKMSGGRSILVETPAGAAVQIPYLEGLVLNTFVPPLDPSAMPVKTGVDIPNLPKEPTKVEFVDQSPALAGSNAGKNPRTADPVSETIQQADETRAPDSAPGVNKPQSEAAIEEVAAEEAATKPPRSKKTASKKTTPQKTTPKKKADDPEAFILDKTRKESKGKATRGRATRSDGVYHQYDNKRQGWGYYQPDGTEIDFIKGKKTVADAKFNKKYPVAADATPPAAAADATPPAAAAPAPAAAGEAFDADPQALAIALDLTPEDVATRSDDFWRVVDPENLGAMVSGDEAAIEALVTQVLEGRSAALVRQAEENAATLAGLTEELAEQTAKTPAEIKADVKAAAKAAKAKAAAEKKAAADAEKADDAAEQGAAPDPASETPAPKIEPRTDAGTFVKVGGRRTTGARFRQEIEDELLQNNPRISGVLLTEAATKRLEGLKAKARQNAVAKMGPTDVQYIVRQSGLGSATFEFISRGGEVVTLVGTRANAIKQFRTGKGNLQVAADKARKRANISVPTPETLAQKQNAAAAEGAEAVLPQDAPYQLTRKEARDRAVNYGLDPDNVVAYRVRVGDSPVEENLYVFTGKQSVPKSQTIVINRGETDRVVTYLDEADAEGIQKVLDEQGVNLAEIAQETLSAAQVGKSKESISRQTRINKTRQEQEVLVPTMYEIVQGRKQDGNQGKAVIHVRTASGFNDEFKPQYPKPVAKGDNKTVAKTITVKDGDWTKAFEQARDWVRRDVKKYPDATIDAPTKKDTGLGLPVWVRETLPIPQVADDFPFKTKASNTESDRTLTKAFIRKNTLNLGPRVRGLEGNQFETRLEAAGYTIVERSETGPKAKNPASWREANVAAPPTVQPTVRITDNNGETARELANLQNSVVHAVSEVQTPVYSISIETPTSVDRAGYVRAMTVSSDADPAFKSSSAIISEDTVAATVKTYENFQILLGELLAPGATPKPLSKLVTEFFDNEVSAGLIRRFDRGNLRENFERHLEEFMRGRDASVSLEQIYTKYVSNRKRVTSNLEVVDSNLYDTLLRAKAETRPAGNAQPLYGSYHANLLWDQILHGKNRIRSGDLLRDDQVSMRSPVPGPVETADRSRLMPQGGSLVNRPRGYTVPGLEDWLPIDAHPSSPAPSTIGESISDAQGRTIGHLQTGVRRFTEDQKAFLQRLGAVPPNEKNRSAFGDKGVVNVVGPFIPRGMQKDLFPDFSPTGVFEAAGRFEAGTFNPYAPLGNKQFTGAGNVAASGPRGRPQEPWSVQAARDNPRISARRFTLDEAQARFKEGLISNDELQRIIEETRALDPDWRNRPRRPRESPARSEVPYGQRISQEGRERTAAIEQRTISDINRIFGSQRPVAVHAGTHAPAWPFGSGPRIAARTGAKGPESEYSRALKTTEIITERAEAAAAAVEGQTPVAKQFGETGPIRSGVREWVQNQLGKRGSIVVTKFDLSGQANNSKTKNTLVLRSKENVNTVEVFSDLKDGEVIKAADIGSKTSGRRSSLETNLRGKTSGKPVSAKGITEQEAAGAGGNGMGTWIRRRPETAKQYWRGYADSMADDAMPRDPTLGRDLQDFGRSRGRIGGDDMLGGPRRVQRAKPVDGRPRATGPEPEWPNKDRVTEAIDDSSGDAAAEVAEMLEDFTGQSPPMTMASLADKPVGRALRLWRASASFLSAPFNVVRTPRTVAENLAKDSNRAFSIIGMLRKGMDRNLNVTHGDLDNPLRNHAMKQTAYAVNKQLGRVHRDLERIGNEAISRTADAVAVYRNTLNDLENLFNTITIKQGNEWGLRAIALREGDQQISPRQVDVLESKSYDITGEETLQIMQQAKATLLDPFVEEINAWARLRAHNPDDVLSLDRYADHYVPRLIDPVESIIAQYQMFYRGELSQEFMEQRFHNSLKPEMIEQLHNIMRQGLDNADTRLREYLRTTAVESELYKTEMQDAIRADIDNIKEGLESVSQSTGGRSSEFPIRSRKEPREAPDVGLMRDPYTGEMYENQVSRFGSDPTPGASAVGDFDRIRFMHDHQGFRLTTYNPIELMRLKSEELQNYLIGIRLLDDLEERGLVVRVVSDDNVRAPAGMTLLPTDLMEKVTEFSQQSRKGEKKGTIQYFADPDSAEILRRNFASTGLFKRGFEGSTVLEESAGSGGIGRFPRDIWSQARRVSNLQNMLQLGVSAFHASTMMYEGASSHGALGISKILRASRGATRKIRNIGSSAEVKRADYQYEYGGYFSDLEKKFRKTNKIPEGKKLTARQIDLIGKQVTRDLVRDTAKHAALFVTPYAAVSRAALQMPESLRFPLSGGGTSIWKAKPNNRLVYGTRTGPDGQTIKTARSLRGLMNFPLNTVPGYLDHVIGNIPGAKKLGVGYENKFGERLSWSTPFHGEAYGWANYGPTGAMADRLFRGILPSEQFDPTYSMLVEKVAEVNGRAAGYRPEFRKLWDNTWRNQWEIVLKEDPHAPFSQRFDRFSGADTQASGLGKVTKRATKAVQTAGGVMTEAVEDASRLLFEKIVPNAKLAAYMDLARYEMMRLGDNANPLKVEDALNRAWDSVDNRFGQMVYDRLHWNRSMRDFVMLLQRAPGWNFGTVREFGGGILDFAREGTKSTRRIANPFTAEQKKSGELTPRSAYIIAQTAVIPLYGSYIEYFLTGEWPEWDYEIGVDQDMHPAMQVASNYVYNYMKLAHPRTGRVINGVEERLSQPTNQKDVMKVLAAFMKMFGDIEGDTLLDRAGSTLSQSSVVGEELLHIATSKTNPMLSTMAEYGANRRHDGTQIVVPDDTFPQKAGAVGMHALKSSLPFSITTIVDRMANGLPPRQLALQLLGLARANRQFEIPRAAQAIRDLRGGGYDVDANTSIKRNLRNIIQTYDQQQGLEASDIVGGPLRITKDEFRDAEKQLIKQYSTDKEGRRKLRDFKDKSKLSVLARKLSTMQFSNAGKAIGVLKKMTTSDWKTLDEKTYNSLVTKIDNLAVMEERRVSVGGSSSEQVNAKAKADRLRRLMVTGRNIRRGNDREAGTRAFDANVASGR